MSINYRRSFLMTMPRLMGKRFWYTLFLQAHGDHFHGLTDLTTGTPIVIKFDENGKALLKIHRYICPLYRYNSIKFL